MKFEIGKNYHGERYADYVYTPTTITVAKRSAKTIVAQDGVRWKIYEDFDGIERTQSRYLILCAKNIEAKGELKCIS